LQQVGTKAFIANARPVDPRSLPVPARKPSERALIGVGRLWVLHRLLITRIAAAVAACVLIVAAYELREPIGVGAVAVGGLLQGEFAEAGFAVGEIRITGQSLTRESAILAALGIDPRTSTLSFDAAAARQRIAELPAIDTVTIRKIYPDDLIVTVTEKTPVARWRVDGVTFVVDATGMQIGEDHGAYGGLPLVIGDGAADDAQVMIRSLGQYPDIASDIAALSRIADRRWDLLYETGLRVQLPEVGVAQALRNLSSYQRDYALLDRDVTIIDLRNPHLVAVRPAQHDEEADEEE
jgi:cell division protein FtsQ